MYPRFVAYTGYCKLSFISIIILHGEYVYCTAPYCQVVYAELTGLKQTRLLFKTKYVFMSLSDNLKDLETQHFYVVTRRFVS